MSKKNMLVKIFTIETEYKIIFECDKCYNKEVIELK